MNDSSTITIYFTLIILVAASLWVIGSYFVAKFAERAGRDFAAWMFLSLMISPIWMGLFIVIRDYSGKDSPKKVSRKSKINDDVEWINPVAQYRDNKK
jgi:hypothetical protein